MQKKLTKTSPSLPSILLLLISFLTIKQTSQIDCNFTHFQFYSNYSLGKQQELNKTFDQILPLLQIPTVSYKANTFDTYNLSEIKLRLRYLDSRQKAVIIGRDTIGIYGGRLEITAEFNWIKSSFISNINGTATARLISDEILFQKILQINQGYLDYRLGFYYDIKFDFVNFTLIRIDPATVTQNDTRYITEAMNVNNQTRSLKDGIEKQMGDYYPTYLGKNLKNQHYPLDDHFQYNWSNTWSRKNISIPFLLFPTGVDLEAQGLSLTFVSYIKDDPNWKCGKMIPSQQLNPKIYGGLQEFISFSVFQNTIRYAFEKGFLNTELNRNNWQSRFFQFFAGDLYDVIPQIANKYLAMQLVTGNCTYPPSQQITVKKHNSTFINTSTIHTCSLYIRQAKITQFELKLFLEVEVLANQTNLNFKITHAEGTPIFRPVGGYEVENKALAQHMVLHSLNRLKEGYTFGSGWKIYPRDYSHVLLEDDFIVIYDSTHVELESQ